MPITQENDRVLLVCYHRSRQCECNLETEASENESCESVLIEASAVHTRSTKTQWLSNTESTIGYFRLCMLKFQYGLATLKHEVKG